LHFLSTTDAERLVPALAEEDAQSEASEWGTPGSGEKGKRRRGKRLRSWVPGTRSSRSTPRVRRHDLHRKVACD